MSTVLTKDGSDARYFRWSGVWTSRAYKKNEMVKFGGNVFFALADIALQPTFRMPDGWELLGSGGGLTTVRTTNVNESRPPGAQVVLWISPQRPLTMLANIDIWARSVVKRAEPPYPWMHRWRPDSEAYTNGALVSIAHDFGTAAQSGGSGAYEPSQAADANKPIYDAATATKPASFIFGAGSTTTKLVGPTFMNTATPPVATPRAQPACLWVIASVDTPGTATQTLLGGSTSTAGLHLRQTGGPGASGTTPAWGMRGNAGQFSGATEALAGQRRLILGRWNGTTSDLWISTAAGLAVKELGPINPGTVGADLIAMGGKGDAGLILRGRIYAGGAIFGTLPGDDVIAALAGYCADMDKVV